MEEQLKSYLYEGRQIYICFLLLLVVNILLSFIYIKPEWKGADNMRKEYVSLRDEEESFKKERVESVELANSVREGRADIKQFIDGLLPGAEISKIRKDLYKAARKSGISISSVKYSLPEHKYDDLIKQNITFPLQGSYRQIRKFIYRLETMPYLMSIDDLAISSSKKGIVSVTIKLSLYLRAEQG